MSAHPFFIHHPLFRLLSPLFSGSLIYVLILLINNNVGQLEEQFLTQELYVCIGLSYLIQEFSRLFLLLFEKLERPHAFWARIFLQITSSLLLCIGLVSVAIYSYYSVALGFAPNAGELMIFNCIFSCITLIYMSLQLSHQFLYAINSEKLEEEQGLKAELEEDFREFSQGINPQLLFDSFDQLIVLIRQNQEAAEEMIGHLASIYRYVLSRRKKELLPLNDELVVVRTLLTLFNQHPLWKIELEVAKKISTYIPPTSLLTVIELIIRSNIMGTEEGFRMHLQATETALLLSYESLEKTTQTVDLDRLTYVQSSFQVYTDQAIFVKEEGKRKTIGLPLLQQMEAMPLS
ncbi:MAG: histidine kinase [Bacteroidota bacterium]